MSTTMEQGRTAPGTPDGPRLGYLSGILTVFELEMKQRIRSRAWYVMLAVWFAVIALVTGLAAYTAGFDEGTGQVMFELVVGFVLFFGFLVVPALSANSITGDRAGGTLAILQNTLLTPGQIVLGKWLAAWVAALGFLVAAVPMIAWAMSYGDVYLPAVPVFLLLAAVELGIACAIGVGVSARSNRPLFAIVASYLLVALLGLGTVIAYGLSYRLVESTAVVHTQVFPNDPWSNVEYDAEGRVLGEDGEPLNSAEEQAFFEEIDRKYQDPAIDTEYYVCSSQGGVQPVFHTERITWLLAANPFVVVADAVPQRERDPESWGAEGPMAAISQGVRMSQAGPAATTPCLDGVKREPTDLSGQPPIWPLGLGLQLLLAGGLMFSGRRRLATPAGKLATGTRIA
ncbi:ABC transporter permease [Zafaria sp. J156]|uniref:ABC transporter permease n=1 Tax=Zafaria sp. J156 TaxID=3116490 RepID=UPI002E759C30|nr:ABC transporter permease subunit [Zafaria sp. J156]MEE1621728.1 ABC transporter permease subunit [Zafaria sp. J156]